MHYLQSTFSNKLFLNQRANSHGEISKSLFSVKARNKHTLTNAYGDALHQAMNKKIPKAVPPALRETMKSPETGPRIKLSGDWIDKVTCTCISVSLVMYCTLENPTLASVK